MGTLDENTSYSFNYNGEGKRTCRKRNHTTYHYIWQFSKTNLQHPKCRLGRFIKWEITVSTSLGKNRIKGFHTCTVGLHHSELNEPCIYSVIFQHYCRFSIFSMVERITMALGQILLSFYLTTVIINLDLCIFIIYQSYKPKFSLPSQIIKKG